MPTSAINTWSESTRLDPLYESDDAELQNVTIAASLTLAKGTVMAEKVGANEVQTVTISATGGTFTISYGGQTTAAIAYNATAAAVEEALELLSSIGENNVAVTGAAGGPYTITFQNALGFQNVAQVTTGAGSLTGGAGTATPATTTGGSAGTAGTFAAYNPDATDGTQFPRGLLQYAVTTDGSGNITLPGDWGATVKAAPIYMRGYFNTGDCVGLDQNAITLLGGTILQGTFTSGIFRF